MPGWRWLAGVVMVAWLCAGSAAQVATPGGSNTVASPAPTFAPAPAGARRTDASAAVPPASVPAEGLAPSPSAGLPAASAPASTQTPATESPGVAARFPAPDVSYHTPTFERGGTEFTSNAELRALMRGLLRDGEGQANPTTIRSITRLVSMCVATFTPTLSRAISRS